MADSSRGEPVRGVSALERADDATVTPGLGAGHDRRGERLEILDLEGESAERVAGERIESRRYENELRNEPRGRLVDAALERFEVVRARQAAGLRDVPDRSVGAPILGGAGARVPRPLMHRHEMDVRLVLDQ